MKRFPVAKEKKPQFPSRYGSHASMLIDPGQDIEPGTVVCKDEFGEYVTFANRIDNGLADSKRWDRDVVRRANTASKEKR